MATVAKNTRSTTINLAVSSAGPFLLGFRLFDDDDVRVYVAGVEVTNWTLTSAYVDGFDDNASITFAAAVTAPTTIIIDSALVPSRSDDLVNGDVGLVYRLNIELGRVWSALAELRRDSDRSVRGFDPLVPVDGVDFGLVFGAEGFATAASGSASAAAASAAAALAAQNTILKPKGQWLTATAYVLGDLVYQLGSQYECITAHTSGTFATDLAGAKWRVFVLQGAAGAGTGDVLQANAGSEYSGVAGTFRNNISAFGAAITAQTATDVLTLATSNPRGFAFYAGASLTNAPSGYTTGDVFFTKGTDSNNVTILWLRTDGQIFMNVKVAGTWSGWVQQATEAWVTGQIAASKQMLHIRDERASGTDGGTFTAGSYIVRPLNAIKMNSIPGMSLAANRITLPAGTYEINALAAAHRVAATKAILYNVTDAATAVVGVSTYADTTYGGSVMAAVRGQFTIAAPKQFELRHRCSNTYAARGLGVAANFGDIEVYADVLIRKIS